MASDQNNKSNGKINLEAGCGMLIHGEKKYISFLDKNGITIPFGGCGKRYLSLLGGQLDCVSLAGFIAEMYGLNIKLIQDTDNKFIFKFC